MRAIVRITFVLLSTILILNSCKRTENQSYRAYYQTINSEYAKIRAAQAAHAEMGDLDVEDDFVRNDIAQLEKELAEAQARAQAYKEALDRQPAASAVAQESESPRVDDDFNIDDYDSEIFKEDAVTPTNGYEGKLKKFNVVVATLSKQFGVNFLTNAFSRTNEPVVVVQNKRGLYYFVLGSYNDANQAMAKRQEVLAKYAESYSHRDLMRTYGIPFSDTWILVNTEGY